MSGEFLSNSQVRGNALKLAKRIFDDAFRPDVNLRSSSTAEKARLKTSRP